MNCEHVRLQKLRGGARLPKEEYYPSHANLNDALEFTRLHVYALRTTATASRINSLGADSPLASHQVFPFAPPAPSSALPLDSTGPGSPLITAPSTSTTSSRTMASCQTWTPSSHIRHPWFEAPVAKRKHRDTLEQGEPDPDASSSSSSPSHSPSLSPQTFASPSPVPFALRTARPPPAKRRRCSPIENGLAQLSLDPTTTLPVTLQAPTPNLQAGAGDAYPQVLELPTTPIPISTLTSTMSTPVPLPMVAQEVTMDLDMDVPPSSLSNLPLTAYTVEDPAAFPLQPAPIASVLPEVSMRPPPAWYEPAPDRASFPYSLTAPLGARTELPLTALAYSFGSIPPGIVITDLDAFSREDEDEEEEEERRRRGSPESEQTTTSASASTDEEDVGGVKVNEALLARIRAGRKVGRVAPPKEQGTSQALVLFRPLPLTTFEREKAEDKAAAPSQQPQQVPIEVEAGNADDDAMDMEL